MERVLHMNTHCTRKYNETNYFCSDNELNDVTDTHNIRLCFKIHRVTVVTLFLDQFYSSHAWDKYAIL